MESSLNLIYCHLSHIEIGSIFKERLFDYYNLFLLFFMIIIGLIDRDI